MNTNINAGRGWAVVVVSLVLGLAAAVRPVGAEDGLKGGPLLQQRNSIRSDQVTEETVKAGQGLMSCTRCVDTLVTRVNPQMKGGPILNQGGRATETISRHGCGGCQTTVTRTGYGKSAQMVSQHSCTDCGQSMPFCCATSTGHTGMK